MLEGQKYKNNSRNYKLKEIFNLNKSENDIIDMNKVNEILKDIESYQNCISNRENYNNSFNIEDIDNIDINKLGNINIEPININSTFLCSYINNYKFDCKFLYI